MSGWKKLIGIVLVFVLAAVAVYEKRYKPVPLYISFKPRSDFSKGITGFDNEDISDFEGCLLSGVITEEYAVEGFLKSRVCKLVYVNSAYPFIKESVVLSGSFFTEYAERNQDRHAVLNKQAAFQMFGGNSIHGETIEIENEIFYITGVLDDGEDEPAVYLPISLSDKYPQELIAKIEPEQDITSEYVKSLLRTHTDGLKSDIIYKGLPSS